MPKLNEIVTCSYCGEKVERRHTAHCAMKGARGIYLCMTCYDNGYEPELERMPNGLLRVKRDVAKHQQKGQVKE